MAILQGNQMEKAILAAGLATDADIPIRKKPRHKKFVCRTCGAPMIVIEGTNVMACVNENCHQYFVFDK